MKELMDIYKRHVQIKYIKVTIFQRFNYIISRTQSHNERTFHLKDFKRMSEAAFERCSLKIDALPTDYGF